MGVFATVCHKIREKQTLTSLRFAVWTVKGPADRLAFGLVHHRRKAIRRAQGRAEMPGDVAAIPALVHHQTVQNHLSR